MKKLTWMLMACSSVLPMSTMATAQTVSPVIVEYQQSGEGKLDLTNNSLSPLVVTLEPKSFSITPDGTGVYRPLDAGIHVELSSMSVRLLPKQSYTVFYKASADKLPAWFTIYSAFSPMHRGPGVNLRVLLPHTVYLYQKKPLTKELISITHSYYDADTKRVEFDIENTGTAYGRIRSGTVDGGHDSVDVGGFALLPGNPRHVSIAWTGKQAPQQVRVHFDSFDVKEPIGSRPPGSTNISNGAPPPAVAATQSLPK